MTYAAKRDHGGGLDRAIAQYGGARNDWLDLSTGINPVPYPTAHIQDDAWTALPDSAAMSDLAGAARAFWNIPADVGILAAPGASALIARMPALMGDPRPVRISRPTYNEWAAAFENAGWTVKEDAPDCGVGVYVNPNNPDGTCHRFGVGGVGEAGQFVIFDESFCDPVPDLSNMAHVSRGQIAIIKSFGKFWGLAGLRLGFLIGPQNFIDRMADMLGPWPVSGPALTIGARALKDTDWAARTRQRLTADYLRLDALMAARGAGPGIGTHLFRLYHVGDAAAWQDHLARHHIWTRIFPYSAKMLRLGLPDPAGWHRLETALGTAGGAMAKLSVTARP